MDQALSDSKLKERYFFIDSIRGILIVGVVLYHALFDYAAFFGLSASFAPFIPIVYAIRDIGCFLFVAISGVSVHFGRKRLKRSLLIFFCGCAVSLVTHFVVPEMTVVFGVLSFFGIAGLIMIPLERILKRINPALGMIISLVLFLTMFNAFNGYIGFGEVSIMLPEFLYRNTLTAIIGFPPAGFESADYFPILPWIFAYFFGYYLWQLLKTREKCLSFAKKKIPFFYLAGKYTLWIYLIHQPLLYGLSIAIYNVNK